MESNTKSGNDPSTASDTSPGIAFEKIVARIQQMIDPKSVVTRNEGLENRVGNKRQYDVVIHGHFGGPAILGVVECKDHNYPLGFPIDNLGTSFLFPSLSPHFSPALQSASNPPLLPAVSFQEAVASRPPAENLGTPQNTNEPCS